MKTLQVEKGEDVYTYSAHITGKCVHIYKESEIQNIVRCPDKVVDCCLTESACGGDISQWQLFLLTRKGCIFRILQNEVTSNRNSENSETAVTGTKFANQEIFTNLLDERKTCVPFTIQSATEDVYMVDEKQALLQVSANPLHISVACGFVVIVTEHTRYYTINLFTLVSLTTAQVDNEPIAKYNVPRNGKKAILKPSEFLTYFVISELHRGDLTKSSSTLVLPAAFFKALFCPQFALVNSPVLLICPPDGSVFYLPIKAVDTTEKIEENETKFQIFCHTNFSVTFISVVELKLIKAEKEVNATHSLKHTDSLDYEWLSALIICTSDGMLLVVTPGVKDSQHIHFLSSTIPGPIAGFCAHKSYLYHTTGSDLFETCMTIIYDAQSQRLDVGKSQNLSYHGAQDVHFLPKFGEVQPIKCNILSRMSNLRVKIIHLDELTAKTKDFRDHCTKAGQRIGELLQHLDSCSVKCEAAGALQVKYSTFLSQVRYSTHLLGNQRKQDVFDVKFKIKNHFDGILSDHDWLLVCHVTNKSSISLSSDWMIVVSIEKNSSGKCGQQTSTYSFNVNEGLDSGAKYSIKISPVLEVYSLLNPLRVTVSLVLHLPEFIHSSVVADNPDLCGIKTLPITVSVRTLDILDGLTSVDRKKLTNLQQDKSLDDALVALAKSRSISECCSSLNLSSGHAFCGPIDMKITIPANIAKAEPLAKHGKGNRAFLRYLLENSDVDQVQTDEISLMTRSGIKVTLCVHTSDSEPVLVIQTSHIAVAAAVRQAILTRLKNLDSSSTNREVDKGSLIKMISQITTLEDCLKDLRMLHDEKERSDTTRGLLQIYGRLRNTLAMQVNT